jgi:hypothetical protein
MRENELLKERAQNIEILREENNSLRISIENKDKLLAEYNRMKVRQILMFFSQFHHYDS